MTVRTPDFVVWTDTGSIWLVTPQNEQAREHLAENVNDEAQWWGSALAVEHRYIGSLVTALASEGFHVRVE